MKATARIASNRTAKKSTLDIDLLPLPYVEMDARGIIVRANRAAHAINHPLQGDLIGKSGWDLLAIDEKNRSTSAFLSLMASGDEPPSICRSIFDRSGQFRTYEIHRSIIRTTGGKPAGMRMILVDVTEKKNALEEAQRTCQWLESAMRSVAEAVILTDALGVIRSVNPAAEALLGFSASELEGKVIEETAPILEYRSLDGPALNRRVAIDRSTKGVARILVRNGGKVNVEISTSPIFDKDSGSVSGVAAILRPADASF